MKLLPTAYADNPLWQAVPPPVVTHTILEGEKVPVLKKSEKVLIVGEDNDTHWIGITKYTYLQIAKFVSYLVKMLL